MKTAMRTLLTLSIIGDGFVFAWQRIWNDRRLRLDKPPLIDFSAGELLALYVGLTLLAVLSFSWLRRHGRLVERRWSFIIGLALFLLAVRGLGFSYTYATAPRDRAAVVLTIAHLRQSLGAVKAFTAKFGEPPASLGQAVFENGALKDGWGFRLGYEIDRPRREIRVFARGAPDRVSRFKPYADQLSVRATY